MIYENYFKDTFKSIPDCRKTVLIKFLIQNDKDQSLSFKFRV